MGLSITFIYYALVVIGKGSLSPSAISLMDTINAHSGTLGAYTAVIVTTTASFIRFRKTSDLAIVHAQLTTHMVGLIAFIGYYYLQKTHLIWTWTWFSIEIGMLIFPTVAAYYGKKSIPKSISTYSDLSVREKEVAIEVGKGLSNKDIAETLHISEETVKSHLKNIYKKRNIKKRYELIAQSKTRTN